MKIINLIKKNHNQLLSIVVVIVLCVLVAIRYDYYYELNDDVLMKDILAGVYTGNPESHNIQMLWLISALISFFYRVARNVAWYGLFLCVCHYSCIYLLLERTLSLIERKSRKYLVVITFVAAIISLYLEHLVFAQYTITVALMAATAAYLFYTTNRELPNKEFLKKNILTIVIIFIAFLLRSEMMLLMMPFIAATGLIAWSRQQKPFAKENWVRFLTIVGGIVLGMFVGEVTHMIAYKSEGWTTFTHLFDERTELYDYQYVPEYQGNETFYESIGLTESERNLLKNYNYGLNPEINAEILGQVAAYANQIRPEDFVGNLKRSIKEYAWNLLHFYNNTYSLTVVLLYMAWLVAIILRKEGTIGQHLCIILWRAGVLFAARSVCWMYIIMGRRYPDRITHSLFIIEAIVLVAFVLVEYREKIRDVDFLTMVTTILVLMSILISIPSKLAYIDTRIARQDFVNQYGDAIDTYVRNHPKNFYFEDVYSTIYEGQSFNQKMFKNVNNQYKNCDLLGGWFSMSPAYREKLRHYGITEPRDAFIEMDNVYIICELAAGMDWATDYYKDQGIEVTVNQVDLIADQYGVYQLRQYSTK